MSFLRRIESLAVKAFIGGEWKVAFRLRSSGESHYNIVNAPKGTCIADPFLYEGENGEHFLFVELFDKKENKACIAYYSIVEGKPEYHGKIIEQPYHMSYPCVFDYDGAHYMIPETSANLSVELYRAVEFPNKWEKVKDLVTGVRYVDTTVLKQDDTYYAVSYRKCGGYWYLDAFKLDMEQQSLHRIVSKTFPTNVGRPAGGFFTRQGLMRPAQNCGRKYGESVILYQVDRIDSDAYEEHEVTRMEASHISMGVRPNRIHTYNCDSLYECVDVYFEKFDPLHGVNTLRRAYLRRYLTLSRSNG